MNLTSKKESILYAIGDIVVLYVSLWVMLVIRYWDLTPIQAWNSHLLPFSLLFVMWFGAFFIFGLYEKQILVKKTKILPVIFQVQIINSIIAVFFFYFSPITQIAPKTNLFIYLFISVVLLSVWRVVSSSRISKKQIPICLIARGEDAHFLEKDLTDNLSGFEIKYFFDLDNSDISIDEFIEYVQEHQIKYIVLDTKDDAIVPHIQALYNLMFSGVQFFEASDMYEALYGRVPLEIVKHGWFLEHVKSKPHMLYDFFKRIMDIVIAVPLFIFSLLLYPFIFFAIKLNDRGPMLYRDIRVGKDNKIITVLKFRSMTVGIVPEFGTKRETRIGKFLRKTRIDELPQLINVLKGDLSLVGPRPEQPKMVGEYGQKVPFYNVRHLIKPGLSGWAQIYHENHPHHALDVSATKEKLSYDLYYIKNRSFILDLLIGLKTIKTLVLSKGK